MNLSIRRYAAGILPAMAAPDLIVSELFKAKTIIDDDVNRLVEALINGSTDRAALAGTYAVDLAAAVEASAFAKSVLGNKDSAPAT